MPEIEASFLHPFSYASRKKGGTFLEEFLFACFLGFVSRQPPPANPFSKPLIQCMNLTQFQPLGAIWGQLRVKFRSKSGQKLRCLESRFAVRSDSNRHRFAAISNRTIKSQGQKWFKSLLRLTYSWWTFRPRKKTFSPLLDFQL